MYNPKKAIGTQTITNPVEKTMNWYKEAKKNTANIPENWDVCEKGPEGSGSNHWDIWSGANDWECGATMIAAIFGEARTEGAKRVWIQVDNSQFPEENNADQSDDIVDKIQEWGENAIKTWIQEKKRIEEESDEYEAWQSNYFISAAEGDKMKPFVKEYGVDQLSWKSKDQKPSE